MMLSDPSTIWQAIEAGIADHLWQSTAFAAAAGLLTLILRRNQARARYWIWLAASIKFLIPFSMLTAIGIRLAWLRRPAEINARVYVTLEQISQPFTRPSLSGMAPTASSSAPLTWAHLLPDIVAGLWLGGLVAVVVFECGRWRRISRAIRQSARLLEGREIEALRRLERRAQIPRPMEVLLSRTTLEPGIFGLTRPLLLWPEGISDHLDDRHLEAILAHELWHVRRRDNLAAALHMIVEAVFWFYPLVWWLGARLVDERERACDEQVLEWGGKRQVYAESILKVCEFCVGSPLPCVSGVTGSDLEKRMVHIMSQQVVLKLDFGRKLLLTAAALLAISAPVAVGVVHATPSQAQDQDTSAARAFQSFSIKPSLSVAAPAVPRNRMVRMMYGPDGFVATNVTLKQIIQEAYAVEANQIKGGPEWLDSEKFDVEAKINPSQPTKFGLGPHKPASQRMLQAALADHTQLAVHTESQVLPAYALEVAEKGPKLRPSEAPSASEGGAFAAEGPAEMGIHRMIVEPGDGQTFSLAAQGVSADQIVEHLSHQLGTPVIDQTGLKGTYDFSLHWTDNPGSTAGSDANPVPDSEPTGISAPSLLTAVQQQLGLKLVPEKIPVPVIVIDHIEKPSEN
jgi:bla regulator protein blaR1